MSNRFKLYHVNLKYVRDLHKVDNNVPSISPQIGKQTRPFLGIVVLINGSEFCIPLSSNSSPKSLKYERMSENITFRKIYDKNGKLLAALNLNNMIPICKEDIVEIDLKIYPRDTEDIRRWKKLCIKELKRKICLNFPKLESVCNKRKERRV